MSEHPGREALRRMVHDADESDGNDLPVFAASSVDVGHVAAYVAELEARIIELEALGPELACADTVAREGRQRIAELEAQVAEARELLDDSKWTTIPVGYRLQKTSWLTRTAPKPKEADHG